MNDFLSSFSKPEFVAQYTEGPPRFVPGFADLHRMTGVLLAEQVPANARILALGAGGGLELRALAQSYPDWTFDGVDPSQDMLNLAKQVLGPLGTRVCLHHGYIDDAPSDPYDGATCLLTLHFLTPEERLRTLIELRTRLKPGAPLVAAHSSFPQDTQERALWLSRYAAFALASGVAPEQVEQAHSVFSSQPHFLNPTQEEVILQEAGFSKVALFYAAFTWRGWVAYA